uniref:Protein arginine N-methyltransferase n=1 Tax=Chenopodium quinoa TaxID=63459 RepID=A0A803NDF1_CHEQI
MSSGSTQRMFQLKLDSFTGKSEWVVVEGDDEDDGSSVDLATTSYLDMLNDTTRNKAYRQAIDNTVTRPCNVLDIGAGTGLLSMMAARALGSADSTVASDDKGRVVACESYLPMAKLMRKVVHSNGMSRKIHVINNRSDELKVGVDISTRADILVSEILDSELLGEGLIPTLQNAHDELLVENPDTVPYRAVTYGQLVESSFLWRLHDLYSNEIVHRMAFVLFQTERSSILSIEPQQYPMHCDPLQEELKLLSEPFKIFEFDFWKRPSSHGEAEILVEAATSGSVNAVLSCLIKKEQSFTLLHQSGSNFYRQNFQVMRIGVTIGNNVFGLSQEKVYLYPKLHRKDSPLCFVLDDSIFLATAIAHLCKTSRVMLLFPGLRERGLQYLRATAETNQFSADRLKLLDHRLEYISIHETDGKKIDLLVGEPFYYGSETWLPWKNLRFLDLWKSRCSLTYIEGFNHSVANTILGACGNLPSPQEGPILPFFVWQSGESKELSERLTLMEFDFSKPMSSCSGKAKVHTLCIFCSDNDPLLSF